MSNVFVIIKMCYVHNQWYDISCATLYDISCATLYIETTSLPTRWNLKLISATLECTCKVTLRWSRATVVVVEKRYYIFWVRVCSLRYPACNAHAPYCHLCPVPLYHIFPHYLINGAIFGKKLLKTKCVFWFSLQLLSAIFFILRRIERYVFKNVYRSSCTVPVIVVRLWCNLHFLDTFSKKKKAVKYQISWKSVHWEPNCCMGRTDRHDEANRRFSQFCLRA